jgi:hypothetical protein
MSRSRRCGFHLRGRNFFGGNFSERVTNVTRLSRSHFAGGTLSVQAHDCEAGSEIGIQQEVASGLHCFLCEINRLWVTILDQDREHESRENHGTQNSRCNPPSIAIESSDHLICVG